MVRPALAKATFQFCERPWRHCRAPVDENDNQSVIDGDIEDSGARIQMEPPDSPQVPDLLDRNSGVGPKRSGSKKLKILPQSPPKPPRQLRGLIQRSGIELDGVQAQTPNLLYAFEAEMVFPRPARRSATRRRSSRTTSSG